MAESALAVHTADIAGAALGAVAANVDGNYFPNNGSTVLYVKNGGASPITVTLQNQGLVTPDSAKQFDADIDVAVGAGAEVIIGAFTDKRRWNDADGNAHVTYSGVSSVTAKPIRAS